MAGQNTQNDSARISEVVELTFAHLLSEGLDDIFKPPLLNEPIEEKHLNNLGFSAHLRHITFRFLKDLKFKAFSRPLYLNVPKGRYTYRRASLLDITDLVRYTALVFSMGDIIEKNRIPKEANIVFSSRFLESTPCFDKNYGHSEFRQASDALTKSGKFGAKIYTDISNFFDRLNLHKLQNRLRDMECPQKSVNLLNQILLHWSDRNSYGIPVGCDASRLLAEAVLSSIDQKMMNAGVTFVRYVDDYRIFAKDHAEAHHFLSLLTSLLEEEGLFINGSKTRIVSVGAEDFERSTDDPNRGSPKQSFEKIDDSLTVEATHRVAVGYTTRIAKYYRKPGEEAIKRLRQNDLQALYEKCSVDNPDEDDLKEFVKTFVYSENHKLDFLFSILEKHIHLIAYVADALTKESERISQDSRDEILKFLADRYEKLGNSEYYRLCIARVLSHPSYWQEATFRYWLNTLNIKANPTFLKELIGFFGYKLSAGGIRELVQISEHYHLSVRRVIVSYALNSDKCPFPERRGWATQWAQSTTDPLIRALCAPLLNNQTESADIELRA